MTNEEILQRSRARQQQLQLEQTAPVATPAIEPAATPAGTPPADPVVTPAPAPAAATTSANGFAVPEEKPKPGDGHWYTGPAEFLKGIVPGLPGIVDIGHDLPAALESLHKSYEELIGVPPEQRLPEQYIPPAFNLDERLEKTMFDPPAPGYEEWRNQGKELGTFIGTEAATLGFGSGTAVPRYANAVAKPLMPVAVKFGKELLTRAVPKAATEYSTTKLGERVGEKVGEFAGREGGKMFGAKDPEFYARQASKIGKGIGGVGGGLTPAMGVRGIEKQVIRERTLPSRPGQGGTPEIAAAAGRQGVPISQPLIGNTNARFDVPTTPVEQMSQTDRIADTAAEIGNAIRDGDVSLRQPPSSSRPTDLAQGAIGAKAQSAAGATETAATAARNDLQGAQLWDKMNTIPVAGLNNTIAAVDAAIARSSAVADKALLTRLREQLVEDAGGKVNVAGTWTTTPAKLKQIGETLKDWSHEGKKLSSPTLKDLKGGVDADQMSLAATVGISPEQFRATQLDTAGAYRDIEAAQNVGTDPTARGASASAMTTGEAAQSPAVTEPLRRLAPAETRAVHADEFVRQTLGAKNPTQARDWWNKLPDDTKAIYAPAGSPLRQKIEDYMTLVQREPAAAGVRPRQRTANRPISAQDLSKIMTRGGPAYAIVHGAAAGAGLDPAIAHGAGLTAAGVVNTALPAIQRIIANGPAGLTALIRQAPRGLAESYGPALTAIMTNLQAANERAQAAQREDVRRHRGF